VYKRKDYASTDFSHHFEKVQIFDKVIRVY